MLIIKPKYQRKKGGSILKTIVTNPLTKALVLDAVSGAAKTLFGKRKLDNIINSNNNNNNNTISRVVNGKGIVYE